MIAPANLARELGGKWHRSYGTAPCPVCQPERRRDQNGLTISNSGGRLLMHCKKSCCDFRDILTAAGITAGRVEIDFAAMQRAQQERQAEDARKLQKAREIWDAARPIQGTAGEAYLRKRGITCELPTSLRWADRIYHGPTRTECAAIVADVSTGAIHRTYFSRTTGQRLTESAKMMLGPCQGGAVRLQEAVGPLVVAEGIETALSLACGLLSGSASVWAVLSTSGMKGVKLPEHAGELVIASDGDGPGQAAGCELASRAHAMGWKVRLLPAPSGRDWNDVLMMKGAAA